MSSQTILGFIVLTAIAVAFLFIGLRYILWSNTLTIVFAATLAIPAGYALRRLWHVLFTEYDRSILIRLSKEGHDPKLFRNVPVIVGLFPFSELEGKVESNLDVRNVIGFVVGEVQWIDDHDQLNKFGIRQAGYYAYCVIQWEHIPAVTRYYRQGFHVRKIRRERKSNPRENTFIGFGTHSATGQEIVHLEDGVFASLRYQPYNKLGFEAKDIKLRQLAPQTRLLILLKNFKTKEWDRAW